MGKITRLNIELSLAVPYGRRNKYLKGSKISAEKYWIYLKTKEKRGSKKPRKQDEGQEKSCTQLKETVTITWI